ncbi:PPOX class F420-dependent oxidoreductase [Streptomyces montanisoli]|uniref:PPOX class F420-dependent oxidoreductase n=1 Tax=Streptomyces montanisoli TaxID=2798581 RepID=A0A940M8P1_9ACTN|nr:PPOX class F420-dependent oxidoreductase [Streptomyces montanisoli]MBP0458309.1 PPOX class F420-dependent oxidoreductase [Streptomyces montanisoli]
MTDRMNEDEWRAFLSEGTRTGKLSTVSADGSPHVAPVWFLVDGPDLVFNTGRETVKGRNLLREGRAALCVDDEREPYAFVLVRGSVAISEEPGDLLDSAIRIATRYMGEARGRQFGERNGVPGELVVRLRLDKVTAYSAVSD